jgi:serine/threonine-protein kinase
MVCSQGSEKRIMVGPVFLGRYETVHLLGEGGMGSVYKARVQGQKEPVVVKVMHSHIANNPRFRERFERETRLMKRFKHPNTVALLDASLDDPEGPCIVMEYLAGVTLDKLLAEHGRLSVNRVRRLLGQFCDVLQAAHDAGIIHRDLKPANLMVLDPDTPFEKLKVMDFGLAELASAEPNDDGPGRPEYAVGTPGYMPPEQVRGEPMDHRGDLYSVGVILYQLLSGKMPFSGDSMMEILMTQATDGPPSFASLGLGDQVPSTVEEVINACLASDPEQRPDSARLIGAAYEEALVLAHEEEPKAAAAPPRVEVHGPPAEVFELEAWLPETIAKHKLRGFADAVGGQIVHNAPGVIRVRLPRSRSASPVSKLLSTFGMNPGAGPIAVELQMTNKDPARPNLLHITVLMRPEGKAPLPTDQFWKDRCSRNMIALRSYFMS